MAQIYTGTSLSISCLSFTQNHNTSSGLLRSDNGPQPARRPPPHSVLAEAAGPQRVGAHSIQTLLQGFPLPQPNPYTPQAAERVTPPGPTAPRDHHRADQWDSWEAPPARPRPAPLCLAGQARACPPLNRAFGGCKAEVKAKLCSPFCVQYIPQRVPAF